MELELEIDANILFPNIFTKTQENLKYLHTKKCSLMIRLMIKTTQITLFYYRLFVFNSYGKVNLTAICFTHVPFLRTTNPSTYLTPEPVIHERSCLNVTVVP